MITVYPEGHVKDLLHQEDRRISPYRHYLIKDSYLREEMLDMCIECSIRNKWNDKLEYDARTNTFYKKKVTEK